MTTPQGYVNKEDVILTHPDLSKLWLDSGDVMRLLHCSRRTLDKLRTKGMPYYKVQHALLSLQAGRSPGFHRNPQNHTTPWKHSLVPNRSFRRFPYALQSGRSHRSLASPFSPSR